MSGKTINYKKLLQPIDRLALGVMLLLLLLIGLLLLSGDHTAPRVRDFSWQGKQVSTQDTAFILTFSRPMNHDSVEANLQITPKIPGKISWAGRRMAFTPMAPIPYGIKYQVQLKDATEQFPGSNAKGKPIEPFTGTFSTRDRVFAYIGVEKEEQGRLLLYNLTQAKKTVLTPPDLAVIDFKPYPDGDKILFSASDAKNKENSFLAQQLYTVTTGISYLAPDQEKVSKEASGKIEPVLDSKDYQNLKFDLSSDGKTIVVQRVNRRNPAEFGLWMIQTPNKPQPLKNEPGGDFLITPDSNAVAMLQGQGVAILPLKASAKPLEFLPKFGMVLNFSRDGSTAAMVKFNTDNPTKPTRSLFLVTNQKVERELLRTTGSIQRCEFTPNKESLYCLLTQLIEGEEYQEEPFLAAISLKAPSDNKELPVKPLLVLANQRDIQISMSSDGLALLFDRIATKPLTVGDNLRTNEGLAIAKGVLWLLPVVEATSSLTPSKLQPEQLLSGFHPRWLP
jgi:hypothetical protein